MECKNRYAAIPTHLQSLERMDETKRPPRLQGVSRSPPCITGRGCVSFAKIREECKRVDFRHSHCLRSYSDVCLHKVSVDCNTLAIFGCGSGATFVFQAVCACCRVLLSGGNDTADCVWRRGTKPGACGRYGDLFTYIHIHEVSVLQVTVTIIIIGILCLHSRACARVSSVSLRQCQSCTELSLAPILLKLKGCFNPSGVISDTVL